MVWSSTKKIVGVAGGDPTTRRSRRESVRDEERSRENPRWVMVVGKRERDRRKEEEAHGIVMLPPNDDDKMQQYSYQVLTSQGYCRPPGVLYQARDSAF